ncbi:MAG: bifunctional 4-hydroxy-2-oxoglutarate aldolase/2-dehydro-3-deoxy-phosphogluconate aldolase [Candidatus Omnitrophica bacterium]|nr:bifunctional 4-hydroxy-2-oxoglutarate aldolase/2-dehydro-3-deoxy-phosphogluconate aldolase [Candidatus Omnitrophota bacterium]
MDEGVFRKKPILGILRGVKADIIEPLVESVISAGLETLEITMNTDGAADLIRKAKKASGQRLMLGAGTVLTMQDLKIAIQSGASFIVMPVLVNEVVKYCVSNNIPVFPGAFTPQEVYEAHEAGATMVKVFPAKFIGPEYFRQLKGPFNNIELLACGGVSADNLKDYFANGASAVSFGSSVFRKDWLIKRDFASIARAVKNFVDAWSKQLERGGNNIL